MRCLRMFVAALTIGGCASIVQAQLLYEETFEPAGSALADSGWTVELFPAGGYSGTYSGTFEPDFDVLRNAANNQPINGNTGIFIGVGGPVTGELGGFFVTEGLGGFENIDPALCERLILSIYANTQTGGADDFGYFAVRMGDFDPRTDDNAWYIASSPMETPAQDGGIFMNLRRLVFDPSPGNWNELALGPLTVGGPAGDLTGLQITGVGIVQSLTNPAPNEDFSNDAFSSWNYSDYRITCVPEPSAFLLFVLGGLASIAGRRRTN